MSSWNHYFHVVWATKNRRPILTPEVESAVFKCAITLTTEMKCELLAINGMPDHVHILISTGPQIDISALIKKIKGTTSSMANTMMDHQNYFRWQEGYYSATVTPSHVPKIKEYIQNQKEHHQNGSTHSSWEILQDEQHNSAKQ